MDKDVLELVELVEILLEVEEVEIEVLVLLVEIDVDEEVLLVDAEVEVELEVLDVDIEVLLDVEDVLIELLVEEVEILELVELVETDVLLLVDDVEIEVDVELVEVVVAPLSSLKIIIQESLAWETLSVSSCIRCCVSTVNAELVVFMMAAEPSMWSVRSLGRYSAIICSTESMLICVWERSASKVSPLWPIYCPASIR